MKLRRVLLIVGVVVLLLVVIGYVGASVVVYNQLSRTVAGCINPQSREQNPTTFSAEGIDTTPYLMPTYEEVTFTSRGDGITLSGWFVPAAVDQPLGTIILVHGLTSCKGATEILMIGGMLHHAGFNTMMIDLRDHGASQIEDGRFAGGSDEWRDVVGAYDWLISEKGLPEDSVGLVGTSLGAASVMIAMGEEPRFAAVWEDSGFASIQEAVDAELTRNGFPTFLSSSALWVGRVVAGDDILAYSPLAAVEKLDGRPIFITHGTADTRLSVDYAYELADAVRAQGGTVEPWIVEGARHVEAVYTHTAEYEQRLVAFFRSVWAAEG